MHIYVPYSLVLASYVGGECVWCKILPNNGGFVLFLRPEIYMKGMGIKIYTNNRQIQNCRNILYIIYNNIGLICLVLFLQVLYWSGPSFKTSLIEKEWFLSKHSVKKTAAFMIITSIMTYVHDFNYILLIDVTDGSMFLMFPIACPTRKLMPYFPL